MNATTRALVIRKATWQMTAPELARVVADHLGWTGRKGGWIYNAAGRPIAHGWTELASIMTTRGWITVGTGINWSLIGDGRR